MNQPIHIKYHPSEDPVEVLEKAMLRYGEAQAFVLVPAALWRRIVPDNKKGKD